MNVKNNVTLIGRLGADIEVFNSGQQSAVGSLSLATSDSYKNATGEKIETTEWHRLVVFGKYADAIKDYCRKGNEIMCFGSIRNRKYVDKNGIERYVTEIVVNSIFLISVPPQKQQ